MKINKRGYWENSNAEGHGVDEKLIGGLRSFFNSEARGDDLFIADIGCGNGYYTANLNFGNVYCQGFDGNPYTADFAPGCVGGVDFSEPHNLYEEFDWGFDWALSLEVGEHIPEEFEQIFLENLTNNAEYGIVMSWAVPGQGGDGHVNCRPNDYIIHKMDELRFVFDERASTKLRRSASVYPYTGYWFRDTIMVFRRK